MRAVVLSYFALICACESSEPIDNEDAGVIDAATDAGVRGPKALNCTETFGTALTADFGRFDGIVRAVVTPDDTGCYLFNDDHVVLEVDMNAATYRMVVNVLSVGSNPNVGFMTTRHALPARPFEEGWHTGLYLDYPSTLGVHAEQFALKPMNELVTTLRDAIEIGDQISVYAQSSGGSRANSAHLIHRNGGGKDGALVLSPNSTSPTWFLFRFPDQNF